MVSNKNVERKRIEIHVNYHYMDNKKYYVYEDEVEFDKNGLALVYATVVVVEGQREVEAYKWWGLINENYCQAINTNAWNINPKIAHTLAFYSAVKKVQRIGEKDFIVEYETGEETRCGIKLTESAHVKLHGEKNNLTSWKENEQELEKPTITNVQGILIAKGCKPYNQYDWSYDCIYDVKTAKILPQRYKRISKTFVPLIINGKEEYCTTVEDDIITGDKIDDLSTTLIFCIDTRGKIVTDIYSSHLGGYLHIDPNAPDFDYEKLRRAIREQLVEDKNKIKEDTLRQFEDIKVELVKGMKPVIKDMGDKK